MRSIAINAFLACLAGINAANASEPAPQVLQEPLLGLRYETSKVRFEPLDISVVMACPDLADNVNIISHWFIYATANDGPRKIFVAGGYSERVHSPSPQLAKYELDERGIVFARDGDKCESIDPARDVFEDAESGALRPEVLNMLAKDYGLRLQKAFGGAETLRRELRAQRIEVRRLPPALRATIEAIMKPAR